MPFDLNMFAVLTVTIINFILGWLWYSPKVLGDVWAKELNMSLEECKPTVLKILGAFIISLITTWVIAMLCNWLGLTKVAEGAILGFFLWLGLIVPYSFSKVLWAKLPIKVYLINIGFELVSLVVISSILSVWR